MREIEDSRSYTRRLKQKVRDLDEELNASKRKTSDLQTQSVNSQLLVQQLRSQITFLEERNEQLRQELLTQSDEFRDREDNYLRQLRER